MKCNQHLKQGTCSKHKIHKMNVRLSYAVNNIITRLLIYEYRCSGMLLLFGILTSLRDNMQKHNRQTKVSICIGMAALNGH